MYKNVNTFNQKVRNILIDLNSSDTLPDISNDADTSYALFFCCDKELIINLHYVQNANGDYLFQKSGNTRVSEAGLRFIQDYSRLGRVKRALFSVLKGTWGFILGVASALLISWLSKYFGLQ